MIIKKPFVSGSDRFPEASIELLTPPRRGSGDQGDSSVHRRRHVIHHDSEVQENQGAGVGVIESVQQESAQLESESVAHDQQPPPPQNHESQESTSQWRSWQRIRSRFNVSVSLSSTSWRRRQDQGRNQENQEEINQRLSHHYLQVSRVMSYVLFYSFLLRFCHILVQFSSSI